MWSNSVSSIERRLLLTQLSILADLIDNDAVQLTPTQWFRVSDARLSVAPVSSIVSVSISDKDKAWLPILVRVPPPTNWSMGVLSDAQSSAVYAQTSFMSSAQSIADSIVQRWRSQQSSSISRTLSSTYSLVQQWFPSLISDYERSLKTLPSVDFSLLADPNRQVLIIDSASGCTNCSTELATPKPNVRVAIILAAAVFAVLLMAWFMCRMRNASSTSSSAATAPATTKRDGKRFTQLSDEVIDLAELSQLEDENLDLEFEDDQLLDTFTPSDSARFTLD